jgi:hypothetical protein
MTQVVAQTPPPGVDLDTVISQLIPLVGMIGVMVLTGVVLWAFFKSDLAGAMADRIRAGMHRRRQRIDTPGAGLEEERVADVERLAHRVAELEERLDFAERLLAQHRNPALPRAGEEAARPRNPLGG